MEFVVINRANSDNVSVKCIHFIGGLTQQYTWVEVKLQCFLHKHDLSINTKVFMMLAEGIEDGREGEEMGDSLVVRNMNALRE